MGIVKTTLLYRGAKPSKVGPRKIGLGPPVSVRIPRTSEVHRPPALRVSRAWLLVLLPVCLVYVATFYVLPGRISGVLAAQVVVPGLWLLVAVATYFVARREGRRHLTFTKKLVWPAILVGSFQVAVSIIAGLFLGFGNSPYASNLPGMFTNFAYVAALLLGMEFSRAYLVSVLGKRNLLLALGVLALLYALLPISPARYTALTGPDLVFPFIGRLILTNVSESLLTTLFAFLGGPIAALSYQGVLIGFEWFSPVLPNLPWLVFSVVGTTTPLLGLVIVQGINLRPERAPQVPAIAMVKRRRRLPCFLASALTAMISLLLLVVVLLNAGFLGFKSVVVLTGSMAPYIKEGDMVITKTVALEELRKGDVIKYRRNGLNILHRIIDIERGEDGILFTTKGDANNAVDKPGPMPSAIQGKVVVRMPKVGWITIWMRPAAGG